MNLLRNQEVRRQLLLSAGLLVLCTIFGGSFVFISGLLLILIDLIFTIKRYQRLEKLAQETDQMLHGVRNLEFSQYQEGELAILANELEKLLHRLTEQAEALQKEKEYLKDSMENISHQLKTPLTSLNLVLTRLASENKPEQRQKLIYEGMQLLKHIDALVNGLLKIARIDAGTAVFQKENVDVRLLIGKALEPLRIPLELRGQSVKTEFENKINPSIEAGQPVEEELYFTGDFFWSVEALENILKNCMEHTPQGGELAISARENHLYTELIVEDNGSGFSEEDLPHIFERFYQGKGTSNTGVGIGLALARMIIREQNGTIKAENRREGGARFVIRFYKGVI